MGWDFGKGQTRDELIKSLTTSFTSPEGIYNKCLKFHCSSWNVLWSVWEITQPDQTESRFIYCDLLKLEKDYGWGHKSMCEAEWPYYYNCPLEFLALVPIVASQEWRTYVLAFHSKKLRKFEVGQVIELEGRKQNGPFEVIKLKPFLGREISTNRVYRLPRGAVK